MLETLFYLLSIVWKFVWFLSPIWLPVLLWGIFWKDWVPYIRSKNFANQDFVLLRMKLPQEIRKSPLAMELSLLSLYQTGGEGNWYDKYIKGKTRPWFSLEIASIAGDVRFYIWTPKFWKKHIESQIYAQYPTVEVVEVEDYASLIEFDESKYKMWGCEFELTKPDPYPIKTYVDYGLDKEGVEEEDKVDPLTPILEYMGQLGQGEQAWLQFVVRAYKSDAWKDDAKKEIEEIRKKMEPEEEGKPLKTLTKGENEIISALERSVSKFAFEVGARGVYLAEPDSFNPINIPGLVGSFKQFSSNNLNGFKPKGTTSFDFPWQDITGSKLKKMKKKKLKTYKARSYFFEPFDKDGFVLNSEELATIFHFPGRVAETPTFERVMSKKAEPPANLPF